MIKYILYRTAAMVLTLFIIMTFAFMLLRLMPNNVYENQDLPTAVIQALEKELHLHQPIYVQYGYYLKGIVMEGNWGISIKVSPGQPAFSVLAERIPMTLIINLVSLAISLPLGILFGIWAALRKNKMPDHVISFAVVIFISVPSFVIGTLMQYILAFKLGWFPLIYAPLGNFWAKCWSLVLPVVALGFGPIATITRYLRGELIETLNSEFMLLARTKGMTQTQATVRHAFRNSILPLTNVIIPMFTNILTGSLVIESLFAIPGVGDIMIKSINDFDYPLTIAVLIFYSVVSLLTMLIVDISYGIVDPRVRVGGKK